jgi:hypothetical protein
VSEPSTPAHLTRQQLDELDALLKRMLELPVHAIDESLRSSEPAAGALLSVLDEEPVAEEPPALTSGTGLADSPFFLRSPASPADSPPAVEPRTEPAASDPGVAGRTATAAPFWRSPLLAVNQLLDSALDRLGRPGRWLRRPAQRPLFGWAGLIFLAVALGLLIYDWLRWNW